MTKKNQYRFKSRMTAVQFMGTNAKEVLAVIDATGNNGLVTGINVSINGKEMCLPTDCWLVFDVDGDLAEVASAEEFSSSYERDA